MALVGDFSYDGSSKLVSISDKGVERWEKTTALDLVEWQMRKNGIHVSGPGWGTEAGSFTAPLPASFNVDFDGLSTFTSLAYDATPVVHAGVGLDIQPAVFTNGVMTTWGYQPEAVNEISFVVSETVLDFSVQPVTDTTADNPWHMIVLQTNPSQSSQRHTFMVKFEDGPEYDNEDSTWKVIDYPTPVMPARDYQPPLRRDTTNVRYILGSRFVRKFWIKRFEFGGQFYYKPILGALFASASGTAQFRFRPYAYAEGADPQIVSSTNAAGVTSNNFNVDAAQFGGVILSRVHLRFADQIEVSDMSALRAIQDSVDTVRTDLNSTIKWVNENRLRITQNTASSGDTVPAGESRVIAGKSWKAGTADAVVPAVTSDANLIALGMTQVAGIQTDEIVDYTTDPEGLSVPAGASEAYWRDKSDVLNRYIPDLAGKWIKEPVPSLWDESKTIDVLNKQPYWNFTTRAKIAPNVFFKNHGRTITANTGSILVDGGAVWAKPDATVFSVPSVSFGTIVKGTAYVIAAAVKTANRVGANLSMTLQPNGGTSFGTDLPDVVDGDWTVIRKEFNVPTNNINTFFTLDFAAGAGDVQGPVFYEKGKHEFTFGPLSFRERFKNEDGTWSEKPSVDPDRVAVLENKFDSTKPVTVATWKTKADPAMLTLPDRNGLSFSDLTLTFRDGRAGNDGKLQYPGREAIYSIPKSAFVNETLAGWTYMPSLTAQPSTPARKAFQRQVTWGGVVYWLYIQWERKDNTWYIWTQGWHSNSWTITEVVDVTANYAVDGNAVDPSFAPLARKVDLAKRMVRTKVWEMPSVPTIVGGQINDNTANNLIPRETDTPDVRVFTAIVSPGPATVSSTITGLTIGQRYEIVFKEGIGLAPALTLTGPYTRTNTPDWRVFKRTFTATAASMDISYTLSGSANILGPAVYTVPGLFVHDSNLVAQQVAELGDIPAAVDTSNFATKADLAASGKPDPRWFNAERNFNKAYTRNTKSGTQAQTISFDFIAAGTSGVPVSVNVTNSGMVDSPYWGAPAHFPFSVTPPGGVAMTLAIVAHASGKVEIGVGPATGNASLAIGRVRNVVIDGIVADTL